MPQYTKKKITDSAALKRVDQGEIVPDKTTMKKGDDNKKAPPPGVDHQLEDSKKRISASGLDRQLDRSIELLHSGSRKLISPTQHLFNTAKNLRSGMKLPAGSMRKSNSSGTQQIMEDSSSEQIQEGGETVTTTETPFGSNLEDEDDGFGSDIEVEENEDVGKNLITAESGDHMPTQMALSKRKSPLSPIRVEARRLTTTSENLINSISKRSLSPIRTGVTAVSLIALNSPKMPSLHLEHQRSRHQLSESLAEGISRSFAGYLTTASMYAGFQDIEDEDREVESIRDKALSDRDSSLTDMDLKSDSGNAEENEGIEDIDKEGIDTEGDMKDVIMYPLGDNRESPDIPEGDDLNSDSTFTTSDHFVDKTYQHLKKHGSTFDLSVVKRLTKNMTTAEREDFVKKKAIAVCTKLKEVFGIDGSDVFLGDYPCWLMGDVLLQGHIYITSTSILFFAFLPKRNKDSVLRSGALSIKSYHSLRLHRKWIVLKEHTLSVYSSMKDTYFPELVIDLRIALRAEIYGSTADINPRTPVWIRVVTENRTHWFQTENFDIAKSWVNPIKKQIFSSRNKGDQVAIKIPLQNIIDLELTSVVGVTKNLRIKVIENADSFAIDDYFVMFFSKGDIAVEEIRKAMENAGVEVNTGGSEETDLMNSALFKSKIEMLKKSESTVKSSNFKAKEKRGRSLTGFKKSLLSSDDEAYGSPSDYSPGSDTGINSPSIDRALAEEKQSMPEKSKTSLVSKIKTRTKTLHLIPSRSEDRSFDSVSDSTHDNDSDEQENTVHRWSSLLQGITSITQNLIFSGSPAHFEEGLIDGEEGMDPYFIKEKSLRVASQKRFVKRFSLSTSENLWATYHAYLMKGLPTYGKVYIGTNEICFRSTVPGSSTMMILPISDIENVSKESGFRFGYSGLVVVIRGHEELFFEFSSSDSRNDCEVQILRRLDVLKKCNSDTSEKDAAGIYDLASSSASLNSAKLKMFENKLNDDIGLSVPVIVEDHPFEKTHLRPAKSYRFTLLTIGSRGDVQPYIALGKALVKEGHRVKIVTHSEFKDWIQSYGLGFDVISGDPSELMALMVQNPTINYSFIKEAKAKFRDWIDDLLLTSWSACQDTDVLIESPSSIGGIHIAEKLQIPYFRAFTMPWTRTRAYPHAFLVPDQKLGGAYNYMTHVAFENGYWRGTCYQVNKWREETLGLPRTSLGAMHQSSVPFLYNISPVVFPPSVDFAEWVKVTGYWFLDESSGYKPPGPLVEFIKKAREDDKKIVYIGFGSIVVENPKELTESIVDAVLSSDVRCILNKGWSDRLGAKDSKTVEIELPEEIFNSGNVPHDWLFTQIDAAVHHGGSGTTGASLRFGLPTIIKPFFGDQKFYAGRVEDLGCGLSLKSLESKALCKALKEVTTNKRMIEKAKLVGEQIRAENGVQNAINSIYVLMEYARKLSVSKFKHNISDDDDTDYDHDDTTNDMEESWLMV